MAAIDTAEQPEPWIPEDTFRNRLGVVRVALGGLNIKQAATLCEINPENWRRWEDGQYPRNLEEVCWKIHDHTGIDFRWLIGGGPLRGGGQNLKFLTLLPDLDVPTEQGQLLDASLSPFDFFSKPQLASV